MGLVALQTEVLIGEAEQVFPRRQPHDGRGVGLARELFTRLVQVVKVEVRVAERVDELAGWLGCTRFR